MKDRQVKRIVAQVVAAARPAAEKYYHVCWWDHAIQCHPVRHTKEAHEVFFSAPGSVFLDEELSAVQWRLLTTRIVDFCRRRGMTLETPAGRRRKEYAPLRRRRWITEFDALRLHAVLARAETSGAGLYGYTHLDRLQRLLETANTVRPHEIPDNVVTMNSQVRLRNDDEDIEKTLFLVFPADARGSDSDRPKLSILTRTGLSMLGRRVGDQIDGRLRILDLLYQPEAAGDCDL
jgi:regulator of nucleoside diphosphate kinase